MKGYPKYLNTKEDYEYVRTYFPKDEWKQDWQNLLDTEYDWVPVREVSETDYKNFYADAYHKVIKDEDEGNGAPIYMEYKKELIPTCKLLSLGFTEDYVKSVLDE